jgi:lactate permease
MPWLQNYDPLGNVALSTLAAAVPALTLFFFLAVKRSPAWRAALYGCAAAVVVAWLVFRMPPQMIAGAVSSGLVFGWWRITWLVVAAIFVYEIAVETGQFETMKRSIAGITDDSRLLVLLIAFAFGALLEGAGGAGAPVAVTAAMMIGLGFPPFQTAVLCLLANSAPVAFGGLGNPIRTLGAVTGLPEMEFSAMTGRILPLTTLFLPFWLVRMIANTRETLAVWPALLVGGVTFGAIQFFWSNYMDPALVDILGGIGTLLVLAFFFGKVWKPRSVWLAPGLNRPAERPGATRPSLPQTLKAWSPFLILSIFVVLWGAPPVARLLETFSWKVPVPGLHMQVIRQPPAVEAARAEPAFYDVSWLSTVGTGTFLAGLLAGPLLGLSPGATLRIFARTLYRLRFSVLAILGMLSLGYLTRYSGMDATLGLALARTGVLFPLFGTLIGWLGVALSGTDAGSNALFGSLQVITANKLGLSPILMGAANSAGGVMGKMIAAQSLVIACAVTKQEGKEGLLFRKIAVHSIVLALIVGLIVLMYAYVFPGAIPGWRPHP